MAEPYGPTLTESTAYESATLYVCALYWALSVMTNLKSISAHESRQCFMERAEILDPLRERICTIAVFIIGATNRPNLIDPAVLRPGAFLFLSLSLSLSVLCSPSFRRCLLLLALAHRRFLLVFFIHPFFYWFVVKCKWQAGWTS